MTVFVIIAILVLLFTWLSYGNIKHKKNRQLLFLYHNLKSQAKKLATLSANQESLVEYHELAHKYNKQIRSLGYIFCKKRTLPRGAEVTLPISFDTCNVEGQKSQNENI